MCAYLSCYSHVWLFATLCMVPFQAPLFMGYPRSGLPCPPPKNLPDPGIEPQSPTLQVNSLPSEPQSPPFWTSLQPSHPTPLGHHRAPSWNPAEPCSCLPPGVKNKKKMCEAQGWHGRNFDYSIDIVECIPHFSYISPLVKRSYPHLSHHEQVQTKSWYSCKSTGVTCQQD